MNAGFRCLRLFRAPVTPRNVLYGLASGQRRASAVALFLLAIPVANVVGLPLSGLIVEHGSMLGLSGWRLMFLIEGLPAVLLGLITYRLPQRARGLGPPR